MRNPQSFDKFLQTKNPSPESLNPPDRNLIPMKNFVIRKKISVQRNFIKACIVIICSGLKDSPAFLAIKSLNWPRVAFRPIWACPANRWRVCPHSRPLGPHRSSSCGPKYPLWSKRSPRGNPTWTNQTFKAIHSRSVSWEVTIQLPWAWPEIVRPLFGREKGRGRRCYCAIWGGAKTWLKSSWRWAERFTLTPQNKHCGD